MIFVRKERGLLNSFFDLKILLLFEINFLETVFVPVLLGGEHGSGKLG